MVCVHVTSSGKGHSMQPLLEKPASTCIRSAYLYPHTHAHGSMYVHVAACLQLCLAHSNCMSQRMYAVCPDVCLLPFLAYCIIPCLPIFKRPSLNVWVRGKYVRLLGCVGACHNGQIESLVLSTCECTYACVSVFVCRRTHIQ